jgi:hypothetical protein
MWTLGNLTLPNQFLPKIVNNRYTKHLQSGGVNTTKFCQGLKLTFCDFADILNFGNLNFNPCGHVHSAQLET